ncbi:MAG: hypothetical protein AAF998_06890 [Bacteroidota bacterium]
MIDYLKTEWFTVLQSVLLISGFIVAAFSFRHDAKARKVQNLLAIVRNHREIWGLYTDSDALKRIRSNAVSLSTQPITDQERFFILSAVLHLFTAHQAERMGQIKPFAGMDKDIRRFFSRPIAKKVWKEIKPFQNPDFVAYIDQQLDQDRDSKSK